ncbi:MAG TPA: class I SAM-dependent methyltransferase [Allosphingosinicella sp.]|nr:class I SAM-dependent methyltransferase [Allosphingosinicella sp.]
MKVPHFLKSLLAGAGAAAVLLLVLAAYQHWQPAAVPAQPPARPELEVPYVATVEEVVDGMLALAEIGPSDHVIDLGCGDGRILVAAARARGASGYGVDLDPRRVREAEANARRAGVAGRLRFEVRDLFDAPIAGASVVALYLLPEINLRLRPRLLAELRPGTRIVSHAFDMGDWRADRTAEVGSARIFLWVVPARVGGRWAFIDEAGRRTALTLDQRFQYVSGSVSDARLAGDRLTFTVDIGGRARSLEGRVGGDRIEPLEPGAGWRMERTG